MISHKNYASSTKPTTAVSEESRHYANGTNGVGGEHDEVDRLSDSSSSLSNDFKIPDRPKGNTVEALQWDIDQRNDKINRLNKKLENSCSENVRLTFAEPTRKPIRTSQDMEVQNRNEQISKLQKDLSLQKQDEVTKLKKAQEKALAKQMEIQNSLEKCQRDKQDLDSKWKTKFDVMNKNLTATQHELDIDNKRLKEEIQQSKKETLEAAQLKESELQELRQTQNEQLNLLNTEFNQAKSNCMEKLEYEHMQRIEQLKAESNTLLGEARKRQATMETEKTANEKTLNGRVLKLEDMLMKKNRETEQLLRDLDQKKQVIEEQHRNLNKAQKEFYSTSLNRNEEFENKLLFERQKAAQDLQSARENYVQIISNKDEIISKLEADILKVRVEKDNMEQKLSGEIATLTETLENISENNKKEVSVLQKQKIEEFENLKSELNKKIDALNYKVKQMSSEAEKLAKERADETAQLVESHKNQLKTVSENMQNEINALKEQNLRERTEMENHYHRQVETIHREKVEMEKELDSSCAQLHQMTIDKSLFENMKNIEMKGLRDEIETIKRERETAEKQFRKTLEESLKEKDQQILITRTDKEKIVSDLNKTLEERKCVYEKGVFEMEQKVKQTLIELETVKAESDSYCKQRDRDNEKLSAEAKLKLENLQAEHKSILEEKQLKIEQLEKQIVAIQQEHQVEMKKLTVELDGAKTRFTQEKNTIIEKFTKEIDEMNQVNFESIRELHQKQEEEISAYKSQVHDRNLKIKDLEEHVKAQELTCEEHQRNFKCENELFESNRKKQIEHLLEEINTKNKHIDLITTLHQSELKQKDDRFRTESDELRKVIAQIELEEQTRVGELNQKQMIAMNEKEETVSQLRVMLKEMSGERDRAILEGNVKQMLQREEWFASENALNHQHIIDIKVKEEQIQALHIQIKEMTQDHEQELQRLQATVEQYREEFEKEKREMDQFRLELCEEREVECSRLNQDIAQLNLEKTQLREEMMNQENQLQEQFFRETTVLKSNFTSIRLEIEQKVDETEIALQNMTHERDLHIEEGLNKDKRIEVLETDVARLKKDVENKIEEMSQEIARLNEEKRQMFEAHQKAMEELLEEKRQMEIAKDKELQETKQRLNDEMKRMKAELIDKINKVEDQRNKLDIKIKDLQQKYTAMVEEKDNELAKFTKEMNEKHQNEINKMNKQFKEITNTKEQMIESLKKDLQTEKSNFDQRLSSQKKEFERVISENSQFIESLQEQHKEVCRNNEQHIGNLKQNLAEREAEYKQMIQEHSLEINNKNSQVNKLEEELDKLRQEFTVTEAEAKMAQARGHELKSFEEALNNKHSEIDGLSNTIKSMQVTEKEHLTEIDEQSKEILTKNTCLVEKEKLLRDTTSQLTATQKTVEGLKNDISYKDTKIGESHENAQQEKYMREAKEAKIDELWVKVNSLTADVKKKEDLASMLQKKVDDMSKGITSSTSLGLQSIPSSRRASANPTLASLGPTSNATSKWASLKNEVITKSAALNKYDYDYDYDSSLDTSGSTSLHKRASSRDPSPSKRSNLSSVSTLSRSHSVKH